MKPSLIDPSLAPEVPGLKRPLEFYWVIDSPAPLAGMQWPRRVGRDSWNALSRAGFRWVVCLSSSRPQSGYDPCPLEPLVAVELDDLCDGGVPCQPEQEERLIRSIAARSAEKLEAGEGVIVHCAGGRGRTGTVLGVVLKRLGLETGEVMQFLNRVHRLRGTSGWPEAEWQQEVVRRAPVNEARA